METYTRCSDAAPKQIELYYTFMSAGSIGLLESWLADGMTMTAEELAAAAEALMTQGIGFLHGKKMRRSSKNTSCIFSRFVLK